MGLGGQICWDYASSMHDWLNADITLVGVKKDNSTFTALSLCNRGYIVHNKEILINDTIIATVLEEGYYYAQNKVCDHFPNDPLLSEINAQGYIGFQIFNSDGYPMGIYSIITTKELKLKKFQENILTIIATRAAFEIDRLDKRKLLLSQQEKTARNDRLRSVGEMSSAMAHEFNQPLCAIRAYAENLIISKERGWEVNDKELIDKLEKITDLIDRMSQLIDHVRDYAKSAESSEMTEVDVNKVIDATITLLRVQMSANTIFLKYEQTENPIFIMANPFTLEEIILEIIINARDAIKQKKLEDSQCKSEIVINVTTENINTYDKKESVLIKIEDSGIGMESSTTEKIFDPFYSEKDIGEGAGLGMTTVLNLTKKFNGLVLVESQFHQGTSITLVFPLHKPEPAGAIAC